jgi:cytochrome c
MSKILLALLVVSSAACGGSKSKPAPKAPPVATPAPAPKPAPPPEPAKPSEAELAAAALTEQYGTGKEVFTKHCASCHGDNGEGNAKNPPLVGDKALPEKATFAKSKLRKKVAFKTAKDVFDFVSKKMPIDKPGTLSEDEYLAVLAWDLNENKVALDKKLDVAGLAAVKLR